MSMNKSNTEGGYGQRFDFGQQRLPAANNRLLRDLTKDCRASSAVFYVVELAIVGNSTAPYEP